MAIIYAYEDDARGDEEPYMCSECGGMRDSDNCACYCSICGELLDVWCQCVHLPEALWLPDGV